MQKGKPYNKIVPPRVSIVIINWNGLDDTILCIESIENGSFNNFDIFLVDNCSKNNEYQALKNKYGDKYRIFQTPRNLGFSGGANFAINQITKDKLSEYILLINNDVIVEKNCLSDLIDVITRKKDIGIASGVINSFPEKEKVWFNGGKINWLTGNTRQVFDATLERPDFISGCLMLLSKDIIAKVGIFDDKYFMYYEDLDLCQRIIKAGYELKVINKVLAYHKVGKSNSKSVNAFYYSIRNRFYFMKKHAGLFHKIIFYLYFFLFSIPVNTIIFLKNPKYLKAFYKATFSGVKP